MENNHEKFKKLWDNKYSTEGRTNITIFFVNIFLLLCHILLMIVYCFIGHKFMIAAYFLPAFSDSRNIKRPFIYTFLIVFSYFFLSVALPLMNLSITQSLENIFNSILFIINNSFVFFSIIMFATFYTSKSNRTELELLRKADFDELTNIYNRYALNQVGEKIAKNDNKEYGIAILDIDFFKNVNDTYGHTSGDMGLKQIAIYLKQYTKKGVIVGRWGGEEFVLISPHNISYKVFINLLEKLRIKIEKAKFKIENNKKIDITISIGSKSVDGAINLEDAVSEADINLYKTKDRGRNRLVFK